MNVRRHKVTGIVLFWIGIVGIVTGVIPFLTNGVRIVGGQAGDRFLERALEVGRSIPLIGQPLFEGDLAAHGVEAMALSPEWGMLSSAMGTVLGVLLLMSGRGWIRARRSAPAVTWLYVVCGLAVNFTDMLIFIFRAKEGRMRSHMLVADGVAFVIPGLLLVWLLKNGYGWRETFVGLAEGGDSAQSPPAPGHS